MFVDADITPPATLLDDYFATVPAERTAMLAGGVRDQPGDGLAARYSHLRESMSQDMTLQHGPWAFVQTANCALRREAFDAVGGFREGIRAGEDADLCYRLRAAGWARNGARARWWPTEPRDRARAAGPEGDPRRGGARGWTASYPGSFPARRVPA